jgi:high-affinity Fe2+/Pb2+ permease
MNETETTSGSNVIRYIMLGLFVWGVIIAVGAVIYGRSLLGQRAGVVIGCTLLFICFWGVMLAQRSRRLRREALDDENAPHDSAGD